MVDESEPVWHRFVRFIAEDGLQYCGQPENDDLDGKCDEYRFLKMPSAEDF